MTGIIARIDYVILILKHEILCFVGFTGVLRMR